MYNIVFCRFTIWEEKEAEFHTKLQTLKNPEVFEVSNMRSVVREIKECVTKVRKPLDYCYVGIIPSIEYCTVFHPA